MSSYAVLIWIVYLWCGITIMNTSAQSEEELMLRQLITGHGYPIQTYPNVTTEDKYLLNIFRIPHGRSNRKSRNKPVVLLMHGLGGTAKDYVYRGPDKALPFLLADRNYDVWLGNSRGNLYSRKHLKLDPNVDAKYWDFSWHEIGIYDLPAMISFIKKVTKKDRLSYIGVSQGGTVLYVMASARPEYNKNINVAIALAPAVFMGNIYSPVPRIAAQFENILTPLATELGIHEFPPQPIPRLMTWISKTVCSAEGLLQDICADIYYLSGGYDPSQLNKSSLPELLNNPSASTRQFLHYAQIINSGEFKQFNFNRRENLRRYRSVNPPLYNLSKVALPNVIFYGEGDWFVNPKDIQRLYEELPNCVHLYKIPHTSFNHYSFVTAIDVVELVFKKVFAVLENYNNKNDVC